MENAPATAMAGFEHARAVADAILYEGYLLYPYRRSSGKNRVRWQFGVLVPPAWAEAHGLDDTGVAGSAEASWQQTECLIEAPEDAVVHGRVRFLQVQKKTVEQRCADGSHAEVDSLDAGARTECAFDEAVPQEADFRFRLTDALAGERRFAVRTPGGEDRAPIAGAAGRTVRRRRPLAAAVTVSAARCGTAEPLTRIRVRIDNTGAATPPDAPRDEALRDSLLACHVLLATEDGSFVSLLDPPDWAERAAGECRNVHAFPVLAGAAGERGTILSSPILLYDHPRVAPESPGDLHDATEIDEILSLRTLTLTDEEKREARGTDPRAARIVDRTEALPPETFARLHGAVRSLRPVPAGTAPAEAPASRWSPGDADPGGIVVDGVTVARGSRVRLRPRTHGTDPQDRFLDGRTARVEAVLHDVDDAAHLAVTLEDDPAAELNQWYGRFRYFAPDEIEPLPAGPADGEAR
ncbi:hypothetical protein [Actinomadura verrucosospora]|uniref:Uncharacterized protein n=1 Tax=Actinomadura verrucosospora TaxID=46165 RepID=A0A7D3VYS8_ACTVE|nr:hypothetical protein [Actinomadura verrucosospora]QKG26973.1 hypothetical protein ACTIVE_8626 [Actinomadura verrucosospora]